MVYKKWLRPVVRRIGESLSNALLPPRCVACDATANPVHHTNPVFRRRSLDLCAECLATLPFNTPACRHCALPLPGQPSTLICGQCLRRPPIYMSAVCALRYDYPTHHLIQRLKFDDSLPESRVLAVLLAERLKQQHSQHALVWPECIVPVPLHQQRYRLRGYNQVMEVGTELSHLLGIPLRSDLVTRVRDTPEQTHLSKRERRKNLRGAFAVTSSVLPKHIAVLDDVITTGSTVHELTRTLRKAGIKQVQVWGVARAG